MRDIRIQPLCTKIYILNPEQKTLPSERIKSLQIFLNADVTNDRRRCISKYRYIIMV